MRLTQSNRESILSTAPDLTVEAGPSNGYDGVASTNGHTNGHSYPAATNGYSSGVGGGAKHGKGIARVNLPGSTISEDSSIDREEFVRLVIQSLKDVGYMCVFRSIFLSPSSLELRTRTTVNPPLHWRLNLGTQWRHPK